MPFILQIVVCLAVIFLTVYLALFLIQARRTASAVERLAESAARDLRQIAGDIHDVRNSAEEISNLVKQTLELPTVFTQVISGVVQGIPAFLKRREGSSNWIGLLMTGIKTALHLFHRPMASSSKEKTHE